MKTLIMVTAILALFLFIDAGSAIAQDNKMSRELWQEQMASNTTTRDQLRTQAAALDSEITALQAQSSKLEADLRSCEDALYALLGVTRADVEAFDKELTDMEKRTDELQRMSDVELLTHRDEIGRMDTRLKEMAGGKIAMIPRYGDRVRTLQDRVAGLMKSLNKEKTYTVGTWSRNRDCLWNIAKKPDIYANAWMWPKIWQGNRDKIKDPDRIKPAWVLKIPEGKELSKEEKSASNRYYRKKAVAPDASH